MQQDMCERKEKMSGRAWLYGKGEYLIALFLRHKKRHQNFQGKEGNAEKNEGGASP